MKKIVLLQIFATLGAAFLSFLIGGARCGCFGVSGRFLLCNSECGFGGEFEALQPCKAFTFSNITSGG